MSVNILPERIIKSLDLKSVMENLNSASDAQISYSFDSSISCVAIAKDEKYVLGTKESVLIYNPILSSYKEISNSPNVQTLVLSHDCKYIITAAIEKIIRVWNYEDLTEAFELLSHTHDVTSLKVTYDNKCIVSASKDKSVKVWDIGSRSLLATLNTEGWIWCVILSKDGKYVISGSREIKIWDLETYSIKHTLVGGYAAGPRCMELTDDAKVLYVGLRDKTIRVWNLDDCKETHILKGHDGEVTSLALSDEDSFLISSSTDNSVCIWNLHDNSKEGLFTAHTNTVSSLAISTDRSYFLSSSVDKTLKKWKFRTNRKEKEINQHFGWVLNVALTPDCRYIVSSSDKFVKVWDLQTDVADGVFEHKDGVTSLVLSNNGEFVVTGCKDKLIYIWNFGYRRIEFTLSGHTDEVMSVGITWNDKFVVSGGAANTVQVWNLETRLCEKKLIGHAGSVLCVKVSPDLCYIISSSIDKTVKIWNFNDGTLISTLKGHTDQIFSIAYINSPQPLIISGSYDKTIRIWNLIEGRCEDILEGHKEGIRSLIVTQDGSYIISGSIDTTIKIWNIQERRSILTLQSHDNWVNSLAVSSNFSMLVSGSADKTIKVWSLDGLFFNLCQHDQMKKDEITVYYKGNMEFRKNLFCSDILNDGRYKPWMNDIVLGPLKINALHVCCYFNLLENLEDALNSECPIFKSIDGDSPFKIPLARNSRKCVDILLQYLIRLSEHNDSRLPRYISVITSDIPNILRTGSDYLPAFLNILFTEVKDKSLLSYAVPKSRLPIYYYSPDIYILTDSFIHAVIIPGEEKLLQYVRCLFKWRLENGSSSSLEILEAIRNCPSRDIYSTALVSNLIKIKWDSMWYLVVLFTMLYWAVLICLTVIMFRTDKLIAVDILFLILNILFFGYEVIQFVSQGKKYLGEYWNYLDLMRTGVCIAWIILHMSDVKHTLLTWFVVLTCFIRGLTYFRAFTYTRFYVRMIIETARSTSSFLLILLYTTFAFCVLYSASDETEQSFEASWLESFELDMGGFDTTEYVSLKKACFHLASIINCILMLNLLIAILGDAFERFLQRANEANLTEMLDLIIELEYLMVWKRKNGNEVYLQKCELYVEDAGGDEWEGRTKALERKLDSWGNDLHSQIENFQEVISSFEDRINSFNEKKIDHWGKMLNKKIQQVYDIVKNSQPKIHNELEYDFIH